MEDKGQIHSTFIEAYRDHPFKDEQGRLLFSKLFYERCSPLSRQKVRYTLKDQEHEGYPSLYKLYLETEDPTEYDFATAYFDSYDHWVTLTKTEWFKPYVERFRTELETKLRSKALASIIREARSGSKNAFLANKYILEKGWQPKGTKGRPSKDQIQKAAEEIAESDKTLKEDYLRIVGADK